MTSAFAQGHTHTTFTISGLSKEDAYTRISTEISRLKDQIRSLYSLQNSLAPVSYLPNELLSKVFMHCCDLNESGGFTDLRPIEEEAEGDDPPLDTRLVVSWVSRHWRNVALGYKPLWNLVYVSKMGPHLDYVHVCVDRCQNLYIDALRPTPDLFQFYTSNIAKICYLKLKEPSRVIGDITWPHAAPLLQSLTLRGRTTSPRILETLLTSGMFPKLHSLELYTYDFHWNLLSHVVTTITNLTITWPAFKVMVVEFIHLLESLPLLKRCSFIGCLDPQVNDSSQSRVSLPRLRDVTICDSTSPVIKLLPYICAPTASLHIIPIHLRNGPDIGTLLRTLRMTQGHVWDSICHIRDADKLSLCGSTFSPEHSMYCLQQPSTSTNFLLACQNLNLDNLQSLRTKTGSVEVMVKMSQLTKLHTIALESLHSLKAFVAFIAAPSYHPHSTSPFPALRELMLIGLDSGEMLDELYGVLTTRKVWGIGLQKLDFLECKGIEIEEISRLERLVDHVAILGTMGIRPLLLTSHI
ncbi:hypothetical protein BDN72DRAFT_114451 [Pluteus cervinus]|uniref:Uncharacterized protein n=1 Tax=Pluteus cervinus TaxID=181527 RepID=A0ACD3ANC4_9AGAR|nr:hypothetical protein BDN72DRAFT_114451 [Pluteus cervinus]